MAFHGKNNGMYVVSLTEHIVSEAHMVLRGHRSIVNEVRFNPQNFIIASSGVEKIVKVCNVVLFTHRLSQFFLRETYCIVYALLNTIYNA